MLIHGPGSGTLVTAPLGSPETGFAGKITVKKWFTTVRTVMNLYFGAVGGSYIQNEELILLGNAAARLRHAQIKADSERIKKINVSVPPDSMLFTTANSWIDLSHSDLVRGSVQVFDDGEDQRCLIEGIDYEMDYKNGKIRRIQAQGSPGTAAGAGAGSGSGIAQLAAKVVVEQTVVVHYSYYSDYLKDVDYYVNYRDGHISRVSTSSIQVGEKVNVDYETETNIDSVVIETAIDQAHTYIMQRIPVSLEGSISMGLRYAETYFALSYLALSSARDMLEARRNDEVEAAAEAMMKLAQQYDEKAWEFLSHFANDSVTRSSGGRRLKNLSWRNW